MAQTALTPDQVNAIASFFGKRSISVVPDRGDGGHAPVLGEAGSQIGISGKLYRSLLGMPAQSPRTLQALMVFGHEIGHLMRGKPGIPNTTGGIDFTPELAAHNER